MRDGLKSLLSPKGFSNFLVQNNLGAEGQYDALPVDSLLTKFENYLSNLSPPSAVNKPEETYTRLRRGLGGSAQPFVTEAHIRDRDSKSEKGELHPAKRKREFENQKSSKKPRFERRQESDDPMDVEKTHPKKQDQKPFVPRCHWCRLEGHMPADCTSDDAKAFRTWVKEKKKVGVVISNFHL